MHTLYVTALTELSWLLAYVKLVLCVTKPNDKLVSQCAARSDSPSSNREITSGSYLCISQWILPWYVVHMYWLDSSHFHYTRWIGNPPITSLKGSRKKLPITFENCKQIMPSQCG